jgi:prepilin-type N-terminal cleavage/methylation domain-containing protein
MNRFNKGFSLIELMITVSIMGILSAIAIPAYQTYINKARTVDLITASHIGQLIVNEYIQSTGAADCTNMLSNNIPFSSPNVSSAFINITSAGGALVSCSIIVQPAPRAFGARTVLGLSDSFAVEQLGLIPEIQLVSNSSYQNLPLPKSNFIQDDMLTSNEMIPYLQLAVAIGGGPGGSFGQGRPFPWIYSIPMINPDGSISWTMYSNGSQFAPANLPSLWAVNAPN